MNNALISLTEKLADNVERIIKSRPVRIAALTAWTTFCGTCYFLENKNKELAQQERGLSTSLRPTDMQKISPDYKETSLVFLYKI